MTLHTGPLPALAELEPKSDRELLIAIYQATRHQEDVARSLSIRIEENRASITSEFEKIRKTVYGNGVPGLVQNLDTVRNTQEWMLKVGIGIVTFVLISAGTFLLGRFWSVLFP